MSARLDPNAEVSFVHAKAKPSSWHSLFKLDIEKLCVGRKPRRKHRRAKRGT